MMLAPISLQKFRDNTHSNVAYVHRRKKCDCGKTTTAKQLTQYGKCGSCVKASQ